MTEAAPGDSAPQSSRTGSPVLAVFTSHWLAMVGLGLLLTAIVMWACLLPAQLRQGQENPYVGVAMLIVGGVLVLGAVLAPLGLHLGRRRVERRVASLGDRASAWRRLIAFLVVTTAFNLVIASQAALRAVHGMESRQFCGSCHVMTPESRAFEQGPHAGILCVDCHVGDGALGFVNSKLQGTRQLLQVLTDRVHTPIESAIASGRMIPSAETCESCHWKEKPASVRVKLIQSYAEDEANTPETTLLTMNVGGARTGGIHGAHHGEGIEIRFVATDPARQEIPLVEYSNAKTGTSRTYVKAGADAAALADAPRLTMQCFDCHNRPAHAFELAGRAVDRALLLGRMSASLPFLKKEAVEILEAEYTSSAAAAAEIPSALTAYYRASHPEVSSARASEIAEAGAVLADIYSRNVFPELHVTWGTYPDNRGHEDFPGCFRCHGGEHTTATGEALTNNCFRCHHPAAVAETDPEVLEVLGVDRLIKETQSR